MRARATWRSFSMLLKKRQLDCTGERSRLLSRTQLVGVSEVPDQASWGYP
jgi:hypothetical protein